MQEYLARYQGIAHDYVAGFPYDVNEFGIIKAEDVTKAHESAKQNLKTLEEKNIPTENLADPEMVGAVEKALSNPQPLETFIKF